MKNTLIKLNKISLVAPSMGYWHNVFLPEWVERIGYSSKTKWVDLLGKLGGLPNSHLGKSRLKSFQHYTASWKSITGGCASGTWADLQQAPPYAFFNKQTVIKKHRCVYGTFTEF